MCRLFFFQAEDGIRDLVRSRGLGDVYKRQAWLLPEAFGRLSGDRAAPLVGLAQVQRPQRGVAAVSYTHLTLPTSDLV